ncbi:MAG: hypothetical protein WDM96_05250 [Lacunisphaera sp.]
MLRRAGFSESILGRLQNSSDWAALRAMPLHRALVETSRTLQRIAEARKPVAPAHPRRFHRPGRLGPHHRAVQVARVRGFAPRPHRARGRGRVRPAHLARPAPDFLRGPRRAAGALSGLDPAAAPGGFVYFDLPPLSLRDPRANEPLASFLDREEIAQRVLVLNAAYGPDALRAGYARGRELGATHVVFTHLDERVQWGRPLGPPTRWRPGTALPHHRPVADGASARRKSLMPSRAARCRWAKGGHRFPHRRLSPLWKAATT